MKKQKIIEYLKNPMRGFVKLGGMGWLNWISDDTYLKIAFRSLMGKKLDLKNPKTFNEKLQWLKLHDRNPIYTVMVDKYEAKKYVADIIGEQYIIPTLGVWNTFEEIDFDKLPNQFVLKCTHDSGGLVICRDKTQFDKQAARKKINKSLKRNYFWQGREWPYKNVKPRIIAEKYMQNEQGADLIDYKFYCFAGDPAFLYVSVGLDNHVTARMSFLTLDWQFAPFYRTDYKNFTELPPQPACLKQMIEISKKLAHGHTFLRVDLYEINKHIYFSELTFHPCSGFMTLKDEQQDYNMGNYLSLPLPGNNQ